jgi:predicted ATPase/DNA-binding SARP family transcriptional activator
VISLGRGRQRALLGVLLLHANEVVAQDRLVDWLWGESPPRTALTALHGHVSRLRGLLGAERLETRPPGYVLRLAPGELDLHRFERLVEQERYPEALALWRGPPLSDLAFEAFAGSEIARLDELRLAAIESRFERELAEGRHAGLVGELEAAVREQPLRERLAAQLMLALYRSGRQADALTAYQAMRATLVEELGLEPGEQLGELQRAILAHDPALDVVPNRRRRTPLPASLTSFVGRRRELEQVQALLMRPAVRLLTLTGPGGTGKTRLALEAARAVAGEFQDGATFVPLAAVAEPGLVPQAIAQALDLPQSRGQSTEDALRAFLRERGRLLVLDNLEHLLEASPLATQLLEAAPALTILATSRTHLNLYGETEYAVPPLSERDEAVVLFTERALAVRPGFVATDAVAEICTRLEGLPLAIELAAARIRSLASPEILARLERRLELLTEGPRDVHARQQTLRDTLLWSYDLLEPVEQRLFARLAVFAGGWSLDAAEAVCCRRLGLGAADGLRSLAEKNLILRDGEARFGMLETIRELAAERLAAGGEEPEVRAAHARWFLALAEADGPNRRGAQRADWHDRVARDRGNLGAALAGGDAETGLRLAAGLAPFWVAYGLISAGRRSLAAALDGEGEHTVGRARALAATGLLAALDGDLEVAERACGEGLARERSGEEWYRAVCLNVLGTVARYAGRWDEARQRYDDALALATRSDLWWPAALARTNLGMLAGLEGRHAEEVDRHVEAAAISRAAGDDWFEAASLMNGARALRRLGDLDRATALQREALDGFAALENAWGIAACLDAFAVLAADRGQHVRAARLYGAEEATRQRAGIALWPTLRAEHEAGVEATASVLGSSAWTRALDEGRALTEEGAIAEARAVAALQPPVATG